MPWDTHIATALNQYPVGRSLGRWRSSESQTAVDVLRRLIAGKAGDHTLKSNVDFLLDGHSLSPAAVDDSLRPLKAGGRLYNLLLTARNNALQEVPAPRAGAAAAAIAAAPRVVPAPRPPTPPPPASAAAAAAPQAPPRPVVAEFWREHERIARAMLEDPQMRSIVVMNPNDAYGASEAAKRAAKTAEKSEHFRNYLTSMMILPKGAADWDGLGSRTIVWQMGNCQQVMAAAFHNLSSNPRWVLPIDLMHVKGHHFLVVGRPADSDVHNPALWGNAFVVDLWLQNLHRPDNDVWPDLGLKVCRKYDWLIGHRAELVSDCRWEGR